MTDKINDIYSFYDAILTACGYETKANGEIWLGGKEPKQVALSGGKVVLPLKSKLKNPQEDEMFFHPLCEQMTRYESEIFKLIKRSMTINLTTSVNKLGLGLIKLQDDPALQRKLNINQIEVIKGIASVDKNSYMAWSKMMFYSFKHHSDRMDKWPVHIFLKRNGTLGKESFRRVASVSFPFAEYIIGGGRVYDDNGKDMFRNKDYPCFKEVFTAIFPNAADPGETYNAGWNDPVAPYLSAFLLAYLNISNRINELCDMFSDVFEECDVSTDDIRLKNDEWSWLFTEKDSDALSVMSRVIPQLKGNTGATSEDEAKEEARETSREVRPRPAERAPTIEATPVKVEAKKEEPPANETPQQAAERKQLEEARAKRAAWLAEQEEEKREDEKRRARRQEREDERRREDEEYERARREREERRSERSSETPPWEDEPVKKDGKISASAIFGGSRDRDRRDRDYDRRDDRDYRDRRDSRRDRDYDRRDSRDFFDRQERRDRDYDRRDDRRDGPWGGRRDRDYDRRDDRDYRDRRDSRRDGPWGRR